MENFNEDNKKRDWIIILKGFLFSIITTLIMIFVLSIILSMSNIKDDIIMPTVIFISTFCILMGGFIVGKKTKQKGIIYGSLVGVIYMIVLYLISSIMNSNFLLNANSITMILTGIIGGGVGGILGVNLK